MTMQKQLQTHLSQKIIPFWQKLIDRKWGGFYGHRDAKWLTIRNDANKGLVQQARFLFSFSRIQRHDRDKYYLAEMTSTYQFITQHFFNLENGGYYWLCDYQGDCIDHRYVTYGLGFVIYAFSEYYLATKNTDALNRALELYHLIEAHAFQPSTNGYLEEFDANWKPLECSLLADGINHTVYTLNTSLHLLEAYVNLYKASHDRNVASSIEKLLDFIYTHLYDHQSSLSGYLDDALQPLTTITSFGHNIEAAWLMDEAMNWIGINDSRYQSMIEHLTVSVFNQGFNGLYVYNHEWNKELDRTMIWWVQSEAMVGFYNHYQKTKLPQYLKAVESIWDTINKFLVDSRPEGEWYWSVDESGKPNTDRGMAELWKTPYHNARAIIELSERMMLCEHPSGVFSDEEESRAPYQPQKQAV